MTKTSFKNDLNEAIHLSAQALFRTGVIDKATMRDFEEACLSVTPSITPQNHNPAATRTPFSAPRPSPRISP